MPLIKSPPSALVAGDTLAWVQTLSDYPASDGWVLSFELANVAQRYAFSATASGADHTINVPAATTANYAPGNYALRGRASKAGQVFTVFSGDFCVKPSFATAVDARSFAQAALDAVEAVLMGRATQAQASYRIGDRELQYIPVAELLRQRDYYRREVENEKAARSIAQTGVDPRRVFVRFGGAA